MQLRGAEDYIDIIYIGRFTQLFGVSGDLSAYKKAAFPT